ncbi:hypothetical protein J437_LFUL014825 [Ladona fulva]|uniref:Uncharacterized protein n=1 Tax=Ladona fulva TaxID=123851 RepID=A0A8K0KT31_LADFU|nr:hypothetical protein J437_LFUL014825 [Ladona fulva]
MDFAPGIPETYLKPRFGRTRCWFERRIDALAYFYGPVAVLIVCNIIMFIITTVKIMQLKKQTDIVRKAASREDKENRNRFNLYLKLLIVMGVNWIMEVVSWAIGGPDYLWYITDIGNTLQGIFIFVIFVCMNKIRKVVMQKMCARKSDEFQSSFMSKMWRVARGSSPIKSSSGQTASSAFTSQSGGNIKMKGMSSRSGGRVYDED